MYWKKAVFFSHMKKSALGKVTDFVKYFDNNLLWGSGNTFLTLLGCINRSVSKKTEGKPRNMLIYNKNI